MASSRLSALRRRLDRESFSPSWLGIFVNPFYFARQSLRCQIGELAPSLHGRLLDVGCGTKPYQECFVASEYIGLEIEGRNKRADLYYDGTVFPCSDNEFDAVFASQVFEHVFNPLQFLSEINRVLKLNGLLLLTAPFVWDEHEQPFDYARYSSFGLRHLLESQGFEIVESRKTLADVRVILQMINAYIYKKTLTRSAKVNLFLMLILIAPFNILGVLARLMLPGNGDLYLDNVVLARKIRRPRTYSEVMKDG